MSSNGAALDFMDEIVGTLQALADETNEVYFRKIHAKSRKVRQWIAVAKTGRFCKKYEEQINARMKTMSHSKAKSIISGAKKAAIHT